MVGCQCTARGESACPLAADPHPLGAGLELEQKANIEAEADRAKDLVQKAEDWAHTNSKNNVQWQYGFTAPPSSVDKYGTPTCGGFCTTPNVTFWNQFTTTTTTTEAPGGGGGEAGADGAGADGAGAE